MTAVFDAEPPEDDWSEEQWLEWLAEAPTDPDTGRAHPLTRVARTSGGSVLGAAMLGLERAIYGERPQTEVVEVADDDGLKLDLDPDDPGSSRLILGSD